MTLEMVRLTLTSIVCSLAQTKRPDIINPLAVIFSSYNSLRVMGGGKRTVTEF